MNDFLPNFDQTRTFTFPWDRAHREDHPVFHPPYTEDPYHPDPYNRIG